MNAARAAAALLIVAGDIWLCVACWKRQTVLGGLLGAASIAAVIVGIGSGSGGQLGNYSLGGAAAALVIGTALYGIGRALERLLDEGAGPEADRPR